ncbi:MAG: hypothetical protein J5588_01895 [Bacteroidales bacterium]|jgi:hypothetical protein|nr:hypothetical protein [Bacteroidales bacterium]
MSQITDLILKQVKSSASGTNLSSSVLDGLTDSIFGSVKEKAQSASGIEQITSLFTGKTSAESSPITQLASQLFTKNAAKKLGLDDSTVKIATSLLPTIIGKITSKDSGIDLTSILTSLGASAAGSSSKGDLLGAATSILGKFFKK